MTRIDFEEGELGSKYEKELNQVISDLDEKVEEVIPEEETEFDERLSPKLEKMILNSPAPEKRKEFVQNTTVKCHQETSFYLTLSDKELASPITLGSTTLLDGI